MIKNIPLTYEEHGVVKLTGIALTRKETISYEKINELIDTLNEMFDL